MTNKKKQQQQKQKTKKLLLLTNVMLDAEIVILERQISRELNLHTWNMK